MVGLQAGPGGGQGLFAGRVRWLTVAGRVGRRAK